MNVSSALPTLLAALTAVLPYENPLNPVYEVLSQEQLLTLQNIRQHTQLLHDHADQMQRQMWAIHKVVQSCQQIPPTPLVSLPWGF